MGMRARLGFAIATAIAPDILLLDEVLGTGDEEFRGRSRQRIREMVAHAKAIVLVTHDLTTVTEFCNRALLMEFGQVVYEGAPQETVDFYRERVQERKRRLAEAAQEQLAPIPPPAVLSSPAVLPAPVVLDQPAS
jgi:ABC-type polysaccharide/polyol phosphate transport system ATPase subunit